VIRMALGAAQRDITSQVVGVSLSVTIAGLVPGALLCL